MKWNLDYKPAEVAHTESMGDTIRLGTVLKAILEARGLSLKEVSTKTGIPYSTLHTWLENRQPKDILKVKRLANYLGLNLEDLLFGKGEGLAKGVGSDPRLPHAEDLVGVFEITIRRQDKP